MMARRGVDFRFLPRRQTSAPVLPGLFFGCNTMLIRVTFPCGHIGLVNAANLPRELQCSRCGASRYVKVEDGARIKSPVAVMERILGEARPIEKERALP
jgi:hypothetical protein